MRIDRTFISVVLIALLAAGAIIIAFVFFTPNNPPRIMHVEPAAGTRLAHLQVAFEAEAEDPDGESLSYRWEFRDDTVRQGRSLEHTFSSGGEQTVSLIVTDRRGASTERIIDIELNHPPKARVDVDPREGIAPLKVQLSGRESTDPDGNELSYHWEFGDGATSADVAPSHEFSEPGRYSVALSVEDSDGVRDRAEIEIRVHENQVPVARFEMSSERVLVGDRVEFDATSSSDPEGNLAAFEWDYDGDGTVDDIGQTVSRVFSDRGEYTVTLIVIDEGGKEASATHQIRVREPREPSAQFEWEPEAPLTGQNVTLDARMSASPDSQIDQYRWDLDGDGSADREGDVIQIQFPQAGERTVALTIVDARGQQARQTQELSIREPKPDNRRPSADFTFAPSPPFAETNVSLDAARSSDPDGTIADYRWDLDGDGRTDLQGRHINFSPESAGQKEITLTVVDEDGAMSSIAKSIEIRELRSPEAEWSVQPEDPEIGESVTLEASASHSPNGEITQFEWDIDGDGVVDAEGETIQQTFDEPGERSISLMIRDEYDQRARKSRTVLILPRSAQPPRADFGYQPEDPVSGDTLTFNAASSRDPDGEIVHYRWDFGNDGVVDKTGLQVEQVFRDGEYAVKLIVEDDYGNTSTKVRQLQVRAPQSLQGRIDVNPSRPRVEETVVLDATASRSPDGEITSYAWDVDSDGEVDGHGTTLEVQFDEPGEHEVTLIVTDSREQRAEVNQTIDVIIAETSNQDPSAKVSYEPASPTAGESITLDAGESADADGRVVRYQWDMDGDGFVDYETDDPTVRHKFDTAGSYELHLYVIDDQGGVGTLEEQIQVGEVTGGNLPSALVSGGVSSVGDVRLYRGSISVPVGESAFNEFGVGYGSSRIRSGNYTAQVNILSVEFNVLYHFNHVLVGGGIGVLRIDGAYDIDWPTTEPKSFTKYVPVINVRAGARLGPIMVSAGVSIPVSNQ